VSADKPDVAALTDYSVIYEWECGTVGRERDVAALTDEQLNAENDRVYDAAYPNKEYVVGYDLWRMLARHFYAAALQSQQARIAELESALREIADMSSDDVTECCIAREALKGSGQ
jgi:hypothetical protein